MNPSHLGTNLGTQMRNENEENELGKRKTHVFFDVLSNEIIQGKFPIVVHVLLLIAGSVFRFGQISVLSSGYLL